MLSPNPFDIGLLSPSGSDPQVSDAAIVQCLIDVELAHLRTLVAAGIAPESAMTAVAAFDGVGFGIDPGSLAARAAGGGNPVIPLVADLRAAVSTQNEDAAQWLHRGATSQDILDSALMLLAQRARTAIVAQLTQSAENLATLAEQHRATVGAGRTLTQHSTPTTYGIRFATWIHALLDARDALTSVALPAQLGGASGTLASYVALSNPEVARTLPAAFAEQLGLDTPRSPWHVTRAPITRLGDALVGVTDALGLIASNVTTLSRTEIGELREPRADGRGVSSAMPQKQNPVLGVLLRSISLRAPALGSTLHIAAAAAVDERPDGAWHAEWPTLRELLRLTLGGTSLLCTLAEGLTVDTERVAQNLAISGTDLLAERQALIGDAGKPADYIGVSDNLIDTALERVRA